MDFFIQVSNLILQSTEKNKINLQDYRISHYTPAADGSQAMESCQSLSKCKRLVLF